MIIHRLLLLLAGLFGVAAVFVLGSYLFATPDIDIPETTAYDASLPAVEIDGYRFHMETFGKQDAPVVVVLHGGPGNDYRMLLDLKMLADTYRVVFYDQRGSGLSPRVDGEEQITVAQFISDLHQIGLHYSPSAPFRLIGHSWGGMLATAYIGKHPERVYQAVLAEPGFLNPEGAKRFIKDFGSLKPPMTWAVFNVMYWTYLESLHIDVSDEQGGKDYFMQKLSTMDVTENPMLKYFCNESLRTAKMTPWRFGFNVSTTMLSNLANKDGTINLNFTQGIDQFNEKVLIIASECNKIIGAEVQLEHSMLFPNAELIIIDGAGHTMIGEKPQQSVAVIREYFDSKNADPGNVKN